MVMMPTHRLDLLTSLPFPHHCRCSERALRVDWGKMGCEKVSLQGVPYKAQSSCQHLKLLAGVIQTFPHEGILLYLVNTKSRCSQPPRHS